MNIILYLYLCYYIILYYIILSLKHNLNLRWFVCHRNSRPFSQYDYKEKFDITNQV